MSNLYQQPYVTPDGVAHLPKWVYSRVLAKLDEDDRKLLESLLVEQGYPKRPEKR